MGDKFTGADSSFLKTVVMGDEILISPTSDPITQKATKQLLSLMTHFTSNKDIINTDCCLPY